MSMQRGKPTRVLVVILNRFQSSTSTTKTRCLKSRLELRPCWCIAYYLRNNPQGKKAAIIHEPKKVRDVSQNFHYYLWLRSKQTWMLRCCKLRGLHMYVYSPPPIFVTNELSATTYMLRIQPQSHTEFPYFLESSYNRKSKFVSPHWWGIKGFLVLVYIPGVFRASWPYIRETQHHHHLRGCLCGCVLC